ncbi:uncharacterized protein LOC135160022 isoform X2 [Diachasmimorpha longicaudata]|uniref:uncharacterized protein LOC135160022 isoform X2 n=1 Tax=Diachasmimorpha longicaudata TaxID=58733 RepID=UPI0030B8D12F
MHRLLFFQCINMADNNLNNIAPLAVMESNDDLRILGQRMPPYPPSPPACSPPRQPSPGPAPREQEDPPQPSVFDPNALVHHVELLGRQIADMQGQMLLERQPPAPLVQDPQEPAPRGRGRAASRGRPRAGGNLGQRNARYWRGRYYQNRSRQGRGASFNFFYRD